MRAFDPIRQADARRRVEADVRRLTTYALALAEAPTTTGAEYPAAARWSGPIGMEDELTGDGRSIDGGAIEWDVSPENPAPMRYVTEDVGAHDGAVTIGVIDTVTRKAGGVIWGEGDFDMASEAGREAYRQVRDKRQNGVSMDLDDVSFEIRVAAELFEAWQEPLDEDGDAEVPTPNADGTITLMKINSDDEVMVTTSARLRAATIVAVPAFASARINVVEVEPEDAAEAEAEEAEREEVAASAALVAAAAPLLPPSAWFDQPRLTEPTALTVTKDGRVYGHVALWGTCHISHSAGGKCVTPPNSASGYAWFHTGALETKEGDMLAVGHLTMSTGHARDDLSPAATLSHYDNTGTVAADVRAYEDGIGIAVAGALRPHLSAEQVREFRAAPLSGDWRRVGSALEMVGVLSVNVPGFGVPRPHGRVKADNLVSLVASGIIVPLAESSVAGLSSSDLAYLRSFVARERRHELDALAARRNRVRVNQFARARRNRKD